MARPLRIEFADAIYHVTARGIERRDIVRDDRDRDSWLARLEQVAGRYRWRTFAFALMDNHFHLFLQTPEPNLSAGMHDFIGGHASYFNARHRRSGHLFQGRFKAILVESDGHWLAVSRYIHLNAVRAGMVPRPAAWRWSSYPAYTGRRVEWIDRGRVLADFGGDTPAGRRRYRTYVNEGIGEQLASPLSAALHGFVLGSEAFVREVCARLENRQAAPDVPLLERLRRRPGMAEVVEVVARHFGCDAALWQRGRRCDDVARATAAYVARQRTALGTEAIAHALGYGGPSSVSMACRRVETAAQGRQLARTLEQIGKEMDAIDY